MKKQTTQIDLSSIVLADVHRNRLLDLIVRHDSKASLSLYYPSKSEITVRTNAQPEGMTMPVLAFVAILLHRHNVPVNYIVAALQATRTDAYQERFSIPQRASFVLPRDLIAAAVAKPRTT